MQIDDVVSVDFEGLRGEREGADATPIRRAMFSLLYASYFILRHHPFVLFDGIGRAVVCLLSGARKALS